MTAVDSLVDQPEILFLRSLASLIQRNDLAVLSHSLIAARQR